MSVRAFHCGDVIIGAVASQITSLTIVYSPVHSDAGQRNHQSSASLAFVWGNHRGPVNSPHKWPVTGKMFPFDDVIIDNPLNVHSFSFSDKVAVMISHKYPRLSSTISDVYNGINLALNKPATQSTNRITTADTAVDGNRNARFGSGICTHSLKEADPFWVVDLGSIYRISHISITNRLRFSGESLNTLQWRHNERDGVSKHQPHDCLFNRLFRRRSQKTSKLRVTGLCVGNSPVTLNSQHKGPVSRKNVSILRRHYVRLRIVKIVM